MANAAGKEVDTSFLSLNTALKYSRVHQDYIAHCFRWSHVVKFLGAKKRHQIYHVLDIGCGREAPLARHLYHTMMTHTTGSYTGVDYGLCERPETIAANTPKFRDVYHPYSDFMNVTLGRPTYDMIVSFEMLEHVEGLHAFKVLQRIRSLCHQDTTVMISTPCYDASAGAANAHVNELSREALREMFEIAGLQVEHVYGTFANQRDIKPLLDPVAAHVYDALKEYYSPTVFATIFAPLYPEVARNCLWVLRPGEPYPLEKAKAKALAAPEHGSSARWPADWAKIVKLARK